LNTLPVIIENTLYVVLAVFVAMTASWVWKLNNDIKYPNFEVIGLITDRDGHISRPAFQEIGVFICMVAGFMVMLFRGTLAEWYVGVFVVTFVARAAHSAHMNYQQAKTHTDDTPVIIQKAEQDTDKK
jgi:hypothetical protein